jgi:phosphate/sulfate permease
MTCLRSNADLALMAFGLGAGSLAYAAGAFVMALALHPPTQHGWSGAEMLAVGLYPLGWIGLTWGAAELWHRARRTSGQKRHTRADVGRESGREWE